MVLWPPSDWFNIQGSMAGPCKPGPPALRLCISGMFRVITKNWQQQVHAPWSWACPLCATGEAIFAHSSYLTAHFDSLHQGDVTESQARAIVGQSQFQFPRSRHICPLCCFSITDKQGHTIEAHSNGNVSWNSGDQPANETHPDSGVHARHSSDKQANVEAIATHVAAHLQSLMLLTLRLIAIDDLIGTSFDSQSLSSNSDARSSDIASDSRNPDPAVESRSESARSESALSEHECKHQPESEIEDSVVIDWGYVLEPHAHALDQRPDENRGMDVDGSDTRSEPVLDVNPERDAPFEVQEVAKTESSSINSVLDLLLAGHYGAAVVQIPEQDIRNLCTDAKKIFLAQPMLLELTGPIEVVGGIYGQYADLLRIFQRSGYPPEANYLFLGNYVDYGAESIEVICLVLAYKIRYPENFLLLRGSHETARATRNSRFYDECTRRYSTDLWTTFIDLFDCMPVAASIDQQIFCVHGGLSPDLRSMEQIRRIVRPTDISASGLLFDLLRSNPDRHTVGWKTHDETGGLAFGPDVVSQFLHIHDMGLIVRGHDIVEDGYEFLAKRHLVTLCSVVNVVAEDGSKAANKAATMHVDESLLCSFKYLSLVIPPQIFAADGSGSPSTEAEQDPEDSGFDIESRHAQGGLNELQRQFYSQLYFPVTIEPTSRPQPALVQRSRTSDKINKTSDRILKLFERP
ncbi:Metallo-dependent phosphatase-like protein [Aspergillus insuetus]